MPEDKPKKFDRRTLGHTPSKDHPWYNKPYFDTDYSINAGEGTEEFIGSPRYAPADDRSWAEQIIEDGMDW